MPHTRTGRQRLARKAVLQRRDQRGRFAKIGQGAEMASPRLARPFKHEGGLTGRQLGAFQDRVNEIERMITQIQESPGGMSNTVKKARMSQLRREQDAIFRGVANTSFGGDVKKARFAMEEAQL